MNSLIALLLMIPIYCASTTLEERSISDDFSTFDELKVVGNSKKAKLFALNIKNKKPDETKEPLVLVHGLNGSPSDFNALIKKFKDSRYQLYVLAYNSFHEKTTLNGKHFAQELIWLRDNIIGKNKDISIIAHSLGGIVTRHAINELTYGKGREVNDFGKLRIVTIDSPWHGYQAPGDKGAEKILIGLVKGFMPLGLQDMRAEAECFIDDPKNKKISFLRKPMPGNVTLYPAFALQGDEIHDYTEGELKEIIKKALSFFKEGTPIEGSPRIKNYWYALESSSSFFDLKMDVRRLKEEQKLDESTLLDLFNKHFPRLDGNHTTVIQSDSTFNFIEKKLP